MPRAARRPASSALGGALDTVVSPARGEVALNEAAERMTAIAELARRFPQARIVFSGGSGRADLRRRDPEAELAARLFESFGIAKERITLEDKSRDTLENARFTKELVQAEAGRALAARHLGASHAALGRRVPRRADFRSRRFRSTTARAARSICCGRSRRWATACAAPTPRCANGSGSWSTG